MAGGVFLPIVSEFIDKGIKRASSELASLTKTSQKAGYAIKKAAVPASIALGALGAAALGAAKAAADDAKAQTILANQLRRSAGATDIQVNATEELISKLSMSAAVADDALRPALAALVTGTKDVTTANKLLAVALDVSAATGADLQTTSEALSAGFAGNTRKLASLSPELKTLIREGATFSDVLQVLQDNFGGAAEEAANTTAGGLAKFQIAIGETQEAIGEALLPILETIVPILTRLAEWVGKNRTAFLVIVGAVASFSAVLVTAGIALKTYSIIAATTTAANTALAASGFAVQISTGVGIASAIAGAAALAGIVVAIKNATSANYTYADSTREAAEETGFLKNQIDAAKRAADARRKAEADAAAAADKAAADAQRRAEELKRRIADLRKNIRDDLAGAVERANDVLTQAKKTFADFAQSVSDAVTGGFSFQQAKEAATETGKGFLAALEEQAKGIRNYSVLINRLIAAGLSESALNQVLAAGQDAGSAIATELLNGGAGAIAQANALTAEMQTLGTTVGNNAATQFKSAGVTAGQSLVDGINSVVSKYEIKLKSKKLTAKQLAKLQKDFNVEVGFTIGTGTVPALADGGIVRASSGGTLALIGEGGQDEAVIPLDRAGNLGGPTIIIQGAIDPVSTARQIEKILAGQTARFGY